MWTLIGGIAFISLIGIPIAFAIWIVTGLWVLYRIIRGWIALSKAQPMPVPAKSWM